MWGLRSLPRSIDGVECPCCGAKFSLMVAGYRRGPTVNYLEKRSVNRAAMELGRYMRELKQDNLITAKEPELDEEDIVTVRYLPDVVRPSLRINLMQ